jgi:hypothetical protein
MARKTIAQGDSMSHKIRQMATLDIEALAKAPDKSILLHRPSSQRPKNNGICHCERSAAI